MVKYTFSLPLNARLCFATKKSPYRRGVTRAKTKPRTGHVDIKAVIAVLEKGLKGETTSAENKKN